MSSLVVDPAAFASESRISTDIDSHLIKPQSESQHALLSAPRETRCHKLQQVLFAVCDSNRSQMF